ncbi:MAG: helix-turn-helix transcriptional regulator, partial [Solirubrobacterales bacterium]|nr:helix-turn-helix transcriptional regulator [Solirubrobacterales bacterium]
LRLLADAGELSAGEVASHFKLTQPAISQHLKVLKASGLVSERRQGTKRLLSVRPEGLGELNGFLAEIMPARLRRLRSASERAERGTRRGRNARKN